MNGEMIAAVMTEVGKIEMQKKETPQIGEKEVLVKVKHVGLCGSDIHYYEHGRIGSFEVKAPIILGHESAGEVVEAGSGVKHLKRGDLVTLEPGIACMKCEYCKTGRYNLCLDVVFMATPPYDGAFVEYVAYPADMTFKLPKGMDTKEGALIEPLAVGFHAAIQGEARIGKNAAILGSGCIGLVTLLALRAMGITEIYVVDLIETRLKKALQLKATEAINARKEDAVTKIMQLTDGQGVDMVFETAGSTVATQQTVDMVKRGGNIILVGMAPDSKVQYDFGQLISKEATVKTVFRYRNLYPIAIKAVSEGLVPIKEIISDTFQFDEMQQALNHTILNKADTIKTIIEF